MPDRTNAAEDTGLVSRNRVIETIRPLLHAAILIERRFTVEQLADLSKVKARAIRTYMANDELEARQPPLSSALSLAVVLGPAAVNSILAIIGYGGATPLDEPEGMHPLRDAVEAMDAFNVFLQAAADDRIDHVEEDPVRKATDKIIVRLLPYSSHGEAA